MANQKDVCYTYLEPMHDLPIILEECGSDLSEKILKDTIMWQCIVDKVLETLLDKEILDHSVKKRYYRKLTDIEENAIRYLAGYILRIILSKYRKIEQWADCVDGLESLLDLKNIDDQEEENLSFLEYTSRWLRKVDMQRWSLSCQ